MHHNTSLGAFGMCSFKAGGEQNEDARTEPQDVCWGLSGQIAGAEYLCDAAAMHRPQLLPPCSTTGDAESKNTGKTEATTLYSQLRGHCFPANSVFRPPKR